MTESKKPKTRRQEEIERICHDLRVNMSSSSGTYDARCRAAGEAEILLNLMEEKLPMEQIFDYIVKNPPSPGAIFYLAGLAHERGGKRKVKENSDRALEKRHEKDRERAEKICDVWASGIYLARDECADKEWQGLGFGSRKAARNALLNSYDPDPWPAKETK